MCMLDTHNYALHNHLCSLLLDLVHRPMSKPRSRPAPLSLCSTSGFDLRDDANLCPTERKVLTEFYHSAKGREWTSSDNWTQEYTSHCDWYGVTCDDKTGKVVKLEMTNNGLSGKLSTSVGSLSSLEALDLSDNDIQVKKITYYYLLLELMLSFHASSAKSQCFQGQIPSEIGLLSSLAHLRLSYNSFVGTVPAELNTLKKLELIHLHSNRISGNISLSLSKSHVADDSSFVSDCGLPSIYLTPLACEQCSICCEILKAHVISCHF